MGWQYVTWTAGAATVAALLITCRPLVRATASVRPSARSGRAATAGRCLLVVLVGLVVTEVVFGGLFAPPDWFRALWAVVTAVVAGALAAHARDLTATGSPRLPGPNPATGPRAVAVWGGPQDPISATRRSESMADRVSEQDDLVQALVVASFALQMGDEPRARQAVDGALRRSRETLDELLRQRGAHGLVRSAPAAVGQTIHR